MRYRTLETQLQTFLYWDSFAPTCSLGEKSIWTLLFSPMPTTAPIYSAMEQPSEWVYYFLTTHRKMLWEEKMYPASRLIHLRVHLQMSSRSCKIYDWNSMKDSTIQVPYWVPCWNSMKDSTIWVPYRVPHLNRLVTSFNRLLFSGPPHLHSYNWKNDNKTGQSSTCTSRYFM